MMRWPVATVEDDVDVWRYAIVSCTLETTTTRVATSQPMQLPQTHILWG